MNRRDTLIAAALSIGLVTWLVPFARMEIDFHHDGIMLKPALDVLSGQTLFRDTFMQYGALTCYLQVAAAWFSPTLLAIRLSIVLAYGVTLFFLYATWRQILPRSLALVSCGLFFLFMPAYERNWLDQFWSLLPWSSVYAMMFQSIGLFALFRVIQGEQQPTRWALIVGMCCAAVFWCRQPVGVLMFGSLIAIALGLQWTNWTPNGASKWAVAGSLLGGFMLINGLMLGNIWVSGALPEWWYQNFVWPSKWASNDANPKTAAEFLGLFLHVREGAGLFLLVLAAVAPGIVKSFRPDLSRRSVLIYYLCLAGVLLRQHDWLLKVLALRKGGWPLLFPLLIVLAMLGSAILALVTRGRPRTTEFYLFSAWAIFSLGSMPQYFPVADPCHVLWSLAPAFGLFAFLLWRWVRWSPMVVAGFLFALCVPVLWQRVPVIREAFARPLVALNEPPALRGMKVTPEKARIVGQIAGAVNEILRYQPDIPSALVGDDAMFLCFTPNRANPTPYFVTWGGLADNAANQQRWSYINRVRPILLFKSARWEAVNDFYHRSNYLPLLYIDELALEIAVPKEIADSMGRGAYSLSAGQSKR